MSVSNTGTYLRTAANLFKGELAENSEALKTARDAKNGTLWEIICNLICHASLNVFQDGNYTRKLAKRFKDDVVSECQLSEKQAGKYTESISAALGVRGLRRGVKPLDGLYAASQDGVKAVKEYLNAAEISTFNQFMNATRVGVTDIERVAKAYFRLSDIARQKVLEQVEAMDKNKAAEDEDAGEEQQKEAA
jgi:hypothetical protein